MSFQADFDVKERVRSASDIVDVIGRDLEMRPQGRHFVARCPFHNDKRPSMTVNQERQSWKCWVCDIGGDVFSFVMQREGVEFPEALRMLAERAGIEIPDKRQGPKTQPGSPNDKPTLIAAISEVAQAYYEQLDAHKSDDAKRAWDYLQQRGIDDENRQKFRIGFAPDSWDFAVNLLRSKSYSLDVAIACGVAIARQNQASGQDAPQVSGATGGYDRFRGRLMFPIHNSQGKTISLGGRIIPAIAERVAAASGDAGGAGAKYINGPETLLFRKSNELYGLDLARDSIRGAGEVLVMEGYTDVVAASMAGIDRAVAVLGTALTEAHVRILKRYAARVVLVLDGDEAGRRRAEEVLELFVTADADLRILTLPDNADPADFLAAHPAQELLDMAAASPDAIDHKLARLTDGVDITRDTHAVTTAIETLLKMFVKSPQNDDRASLKIDQLLMRMSRTFELPVDRLTRRFQSLRQEHQTRQANQARYQKTSATPSRPSERQPHRPDSGSDRFAEAAMEDAAAFGLDFDPSNYADPSGYVSGQYDSSDNDPGAFGPSVQSPSRSSVNEFQAPLSGVDRELFETLLVSPELAAMAVESIDPNWLQSTTAKMLLSAYQELDLQQRELNAESLLTLIENEYLKNQIITLLERIETRGDRLADQPHDRYTAILTRFREREFEIEKTRQIEKLASASLPEDEELAMLEQLFAAERLRHSPR
nr:DNA primase [Neorhodopirellula pilleata]